MSENFPILIDVEEHHVGKVLRMLDVMPGVVTIHLKMNRGGQSGPIPHGQPKLIQPAKRGRPFGSSTADDTAPAKVILQALSKGSMHYKILVMAIMKNGYAATSIYKYLRILRDKKMIKRVAAGTYRLTERGERAVAIPSSNQRGPLPLQAIANSVANRGRDLRGKILAEISSREKISHEDLKTFIVQNGFAMNNLYTKVPKMKEDGLLRRNGDNYELTDMGRKLIEQRSTAQEATSNGDKG